MTLSQKILLGLGVFAAYLYLTSGTANASTASGAGAGTGGGAITPNAGDSLLVVTTDTGAAGQLNIRSGAGTNNPSVALAQHGDTLTANGQVQTAVDGTVWWGVTNGAGTSGWSESNYLKDTTQQGS